MNDDEILERIMDIEIREEGRRGIKSYVLRNNVLSDEEKKIINEAKPVESDDCPFMTKEELEELKHWSKVHPQWYKPTKSKITIMIDNDVLAALKAEGKGYQTRINAILRKEVMGA